MKQQYKNPILALLCALFVASIWSCGEEEVEAVTPNIAEVLPKEALPGALVTIKGSSLNDIQRVLFNDVPATFNPVYNTETAFLLRVPTLAKFGQQKITVLNKGGDATKILIDFKVIQPPPLFENFAPTEGVSGDVITIKGKVFINVVAVRFGTLNGEIVSKTEDEIKVKVPKDVEKAPIEVVTEGGSIKSKLDFSPKGGGQYIFDDDLLAPWQNWSWAKVDLKEEGTKKVGTKAIKVTLGSWGALFLNTGDKPIDPAKFKTLKFWVHGGATGDKKIQIFYKADDKAEAEAGKQVYVTIKPGSWQEVVVNLADMGVAPKIKAIIIQEVGNAGDVTDPIFFDEIKLQ